MYHEREANVPRRNLMYRAESLTSGKVHLSIQSRCGLLCIKVRGLLHLISLFTEFDLSCALSTLTLQSTAPATPPAPAPHADTATCAVSVQAGVWTGWSMECTIAIHRCKHDSQYLYS